MRDQKIELAAALWMVCLATSLFGSVPGQRSDEAVTFKQNASHNGVAQLGPDPHFPLSKIWTLPVQGLVTYPLIAGGSVFVASFDGWTTYVYAADGLTGQLNWGPLTLPTAFYGARAAYDDGKIFLVRTEPVNYQGIMTALDAATGAVLWEQILPNQWVFSGAPTASRGMVWVSGAGSGATLYALDQATGVIVWSQDVNGSDDSSPALEEQGPGVYCANPCSTYDFDSASGSLTWVTGWGCSTGIGTTPIYSNGKLYVMEYPGGTVYDAATGEILSSFPETYILPAIGAETGYFIVDGVLNATNLSSMAVIWSFHSAASYLITSPLVINDRYVFVADAAGVLYGIDGQTGHSIWTDSIIPPANEVFLAWAPAAGDGILVFPSGNSIMAYCSSTCLPCPAITISPASLPNASIGTSYGQVLGATGGSAPYTFAVNSGALPTGLQLSASGVLSGIPTAVGTYGFSVTASDASGCKGSRAYSIIVTDSSAGISFYDDYGRAQVCINRTTGFFVWTVLQGSAKGTYSGTALVTYVNGVVVLSSPAGVPWRLNLKFQERYKKASGTYENPAMRVRSVMIDANTANNPSGCW